MIDNQEAAIFKSKQDFNKNKEKISEYIKYAENWQVVSVICSYAAMACDVLLIVAMIIFLLKYHKTKQVMLAALYLLSCIFAAQNADIHILYSNIAFRFYQFHI